jgi:ATP-dependent exoDNAse (exonuclease V) beta subunit
MGADLPLEDASVALDGAPVRATSVAATVAPLPALVSVPSTDVPVRSVTASLDQSAGMVPATVPSSLSRSIAQALGTAIHQALNIHGPGMAPAAAHAVLAPFAEAVGEERRQRLLARLVDRDLLPGFWTAAVRLQEQPVIGERDGILTHGICDVLLKDARGDWRLYDWKTGGASGAESSQQQVRLYASLVAPHLDGPLVAAALVDVERGLLIDVPLP